MEQEPQCTFIIDLGEENLSECKSLLVAKEKENIVVKCVAGGKVADLLASFT